MPEQDDAYWASLIVEGADEAMFCVDRSWRFRYINAYALTQFHQPREALLGRVMWEAFPTLGGSRFEQFYRQAMATGRAQHIEDFSSTSNGWYDVRAYPIAQGLVVYFRDVSARKQLEASLRVSEMRALALREANFEAVLLSQDGHIVEANQRAAALFGYKHEQQLLGQPVMALLPPQSWSQVQPGQPQLSEQEIVRRDGSLIPCEISAALLDDGRLQLIVRDVGEQRRLEAERAFLATIVESSGDAIIGKSLDGTILSWNQGAEQLYGYSAAEAVGRSLQLIIPPDRAHELDQLLDVVRSGERVVRYETVRRHKSGALRQVTLTISPIKDAVGSIVGASTIASDISARKQLELQLLQSQKLESVGRLAGGIAHDFNNLLTAMIGYSELALTDVSASQQLRADISEILHAAQRAANLTRQLLLFSRQQVLTPTLINLNEIVQNVERLLRRVLSSDVELVSMLQPELALVLADAGQLEQVLLNLAINARDAMPEGGQLIIETANVELDEQYRSARHPDIKTGAYVMLAISDTGSGMDEATQAQIFEPFFTTKEIGKGTGLGLAIVYGVVRQSEGYIWVYSEPGNGTTFKIYLPQAERVEQGQVSPIIFDPVLAPRSGHGFTVLVVEDDILVRELILRILNDAGYTVLSARHGEEALEIVDTYAHQIDMVLTDMMMPRLGGRALVSELRLRRPDLRILCMSGYTDQAAARHQWVQSCDSFLQKPFTPGLLLRRVAELLHGGSA